MTGRPKRSLGGSVLFYGFIKFALYIAYKLLFRIRHQGSQNVPSAEDPRGVILAPNHASHLDPPLIGICLDRRVTYLAKEYLFKHNVVGVVLKNIGAYPVKSDSGSDFRSIRDLVRILRDGHCVTVFPEGTRSENGQLKEPEGGIGFLAMKSGAWVVPVYIEGSYEALPRGTKSFKCRPIRVIYGNAFIPAENKEWIASNDYMAVSRDIMRRIKEIKEKV